MNSALEGARSLFPAAGLLTFAVLWTTGDAHDQAGSRLALDTRLSEGLGFVSTVRPLSDGRVLVSDPLGQTLLLVDLDSQKADTLGHVGSGPREYRSPDAVFPLPGDSTLLVDLGNGRLTLIAWVEEFITASISMGIRRSASGERQVRFSRGTRDPGGFDIDQVVWPTHLPAFRPGRSIVAPNGDLWVQRYGAEDQPVSIDVFDGRGQRKDEVELPAHRHVVGFGGGVVYVIYVDEVGLHWLEQYRIH